MNRGEIEFPVGLPIQSLQFGLKAREECFEIAKVRYVAGLARLKQFDLAENIQRRVVQWRGGNKDDPLAPADLGKHVVALGCLRPEPMGLINEYVGIFRNVAFQEVVQLADGLKIRLPDLKIAEDIRPGTALVFIEQMRRRDNEVPTVQLLGQQGGHVGFSESHDIGKEYAAVLVQHLARIQHRLFLIPQLLEARGDIHVLKF